jgi:hypothetical protein
MKTLPTLKSIAMCATSTWASAALAHDGHAMAGTHWHATDAWGFVALGLCVALAVWLSRGDK